jgi:hypothetical protein
MAIPVAISKPRIKWNFREGLERKRDVGKSRFIAI